MPLYLSYLAAATWPMRRAQPAQQSSPLSRSSPDVRYVPEYALG
jgi:hypothetical protein